MPDRQIRRPRTRSVSKRIGGHIRARVACVAFASRRGWRLDDLGPDWYNVRDSMRNLGVTRCALQHMARRGQIERRLLGCYAYYKIPAEGSIDDAELLSSVERPKTRGDCLRMPRPCPFVSCRHHLCLDVMRDGSIRLNFPALEVWELRETCVLDIADRGPAKLHRASGALNITRQAVEAAVERALEVASKELATLLKTTDTEEAQWTDDQEPAYSWTYNQETAYPWTYSQE